MQAWHVAALALVGVAGAFALAGGDDAKPDSSTGRALLTGTYGARTFRVRRNGPTFAWSVGSESQGGADTLEDALVDVLGWLGERTPGTLDVVRLNVEGSAISLVVQPMPVQGVAAAMWALYDGIALVAREAEANRGRALLAGIAELKSRTAGTLPW